MAFPFASDDDEASLQPSVQIETSNDCQSQLTATETVLCAATKMAKSGHELDDGKTQSEFLLWWNVPRQCVLPRKKRIKIT